LNERTLKEKVKIMNIYVVQWKESYFGDGIRTIGCFDAFAKAENAITEDLKRNNSSYYSTQKAEYSIDVFKLNN
jgi:hypothetical protein